MITEGRHTGCCFFALDPRFPISILVVGGLLLGSTIWEGAPGVGDGGNNQWLVRKAVYINSCQHSNIYNSLEHSYTSLRSVSLGTNHPSKPKPSNFSRNIVSPSPHSFFSWFLLFKIWDWKLLPIQQKGGWYCAIPQLYWGIDLCMPLTCVKFN